MEQRLEVAGFGLALTGWFCAILTRCVALWKVSGALDNTTATLPAYWDGVWLEWDQWDLAHDVIGACGAIWFPLRGQIKVASGALFVLSGILLLIPTAWTCHHTSRPLEGAEQLKRHWGPALYLGWISFSLMLVGGVVLMTRWPRRERPVPQPGGNIHLSPEEDANHPLSRINRAAFTNSQYERGSRAT
ncbi:Claudin-6 Skullin [Takifugu flavidus]|uniref:Claudin-6 Skullin n=1 Tax=Takifugu flavidus TaxID=433684 RepID=A0A5C6PCA6_9TELE|nr:Claudin-6 Skullin [Takifugu flavidus]